MVLPISPVVATVYMTTCGEYASIQVRERSCSMVGPSWRTSLCVVGEKIPINIWLTYIPTLVNLYRLQGKEYPDHYSCGKEILNDNIFTYHFLSKQYGPLEKNWVKAIAQLPSSSRTPSMNRSYSYLSNLPKDDGGRSATQPGWVAPHLLLVWGKAFVQVLSPSRTLWTQGAMALLAMLIWTTKRWWWQFSNWPSKLDANFVALMLQAQFYS